MFQAAKLDILNLIKPTSLVLQSTNLLLPEAVTTIDVTVTKIKKLQSKFDEKGTDALQDKSLFPTLNSEFMPLIDFDTNGYSLGRSTRRDPAYNGVILHSGYTLSNGDIEKALEKVFQDLHLDLPVLEEDLNERLSFITEEPVFSAAAKRLDTTAYQNLEEGNLLEACETLVEPFKVPLEANGFIKTRLRSFLLFLFCEFVFWIWFFENIFWYLMSEIVNLELWNLNLLKTSMSRNVLENFSFSLASLRQRLRLFVLSFFTDQINKAPSFKMCIYSVKRSGEENNYLVIVFLWVPSVLIKICKPKGCLKITNYRYYYYLNDRISWCIVLKCYYFFFQLLKSLHCTLILRSSCPMFKARNAGPKYLVLLANSISIIFSTLSRLG